MAKLLILLAFPVQPKANRPPPVSRDLAGSTLTPGINDGSKGTGGLSSDLDSRQIPCVGLDECQAL
jgi:hypothetical protein